jgi:hypothetical protein
MRSFTIIHVLLLLIFLIAYQCAHAQDFVITTKGDSLSGDTRVFNFGTEWKVQLTKPDKTKAIFNVFQVREFSERNEIYHPVKFRDSYVFMKVLKAGYLSLYAFQLPEQGTFDGRYLLKKDSKGVEVPNLNYKKIMSSFLSDCEAVSAKVAAGIYGRKDLDLLIDDYNTCINANSKLRQSEEVPTNTTTKTTPQTWDDLHSKVTNHADFEGKSDALEMITEIKKKLSRDEKIPNFLTSGLKAILDSTDLKADLEKALGDLPGQD